MPDTAGDISLPAPDGGAEVMGGCVQPSDCPGACQTCSSTTHACIAVTNQVDPTGRCTGTCDGSGICKATQGQTCQAAGSCAAGLTYTCTGAAACSGSADFNAQVVCGSRAGCPAGQICCMTGIGCDGSDAPSQNSFCTADSTKCQSGPYNWGYQICDPSISPTECLTGSCQTWGCVGGLYACE